MSEEEVTQRYQHAMLVITQLCEDGRPSSPRPSMTSRNFCIVSARLRPSRRRCEYFEANGADADDVLGTLASLVRALEKAGQPKVADAVRFLVQTYGPEDEDAPRADRQADIAEWCAAAFGAGHAVSVPQRGVRLLEEAVEAAQAAGVPAEMAQRLVAYVYERPAGKLAQEIGGCGVTLLALAQAAGLDADEEECREIARVKAKPLAHFAERNAVKNAAGFEVLP